MNPTLRERLERRSAREFAEALRDARLPEPATPEELQAAALRLADGGTYPYVTRLAREYLGVLTEPTR